MARTEARQQRSDAADGQGHIAADQEGEAMTKQAAIEITKELARLASKEGREELRVLLQRLAELVPIVREQRRVAWDKATAEYFASDKPTDEERRMWETPLRALCGSVLVKLESHDRLSTPEQHELHSIGLAVAAFGGLDAISEIGWIVDQRVWNEWDGMAGHWL
jgi:hypothetical protein